MTAYKLSVVQLVDFACRGGDLVTSAKQGPSALEGIRAHQKLQRELAGEYQAEVPVKARITQSDIELELGGRVDLLVADPLIVTLAEIKTCYGHPSLLPPGQASIHWAQLKLYGFCYLRQHPADAIVLRMIWYDLSGDRRHEDTVRFDARELQGFAEDAAARYVKWRQLVADIDSGSLAHAGAMPFPYSDFRPGQRTMASAVYRCLRDDKYLLCEAPTGIGKTISALFPALKALGKGLVDKVVYLTAKNPGRHMAMETLASMADPDRRVTTLQLQAKAAACPCLNGEGIPGEQGRCPLGVGFFDRLPPAREQLLQCRKMDNDTITRVAREHQICPFELSLQMLPWARVVICDYNYVFDPLVSLGYFNDNKDRIALLVDEAHNLVDRSRAMYSARLDRVQSVIAAGACKTSAPQLGKKLAAVSRALDRYQRAQDSDESVVRETPATVDRAVERLLDFIARQDESLLNHDREVGEWLREIYRYRHIAELFGRHHRCIARSGRQGNDRYFELLLQCLNASEALADNYRLFHGVVLFSATLRPQEFYRESLGLPPTTVTASLPSPFAAENLGTFICNDIDTRYQQRQSSIEPICQRIDTIYHAHPGNYLAFFPSYQYMEQVAERFGNDFPSTPLLMQARNSNEEQRADFLLQFRPGQRKLGFAIMGGIYGEGIDYRGDSLIGAIVVGVGLPAMDTVQELIRRDFEAGGLDGFDFAYRFPGLGRVLQAAGRVIRSESDRGVVILIDQRFGQAFYRNLLPQHWRTNFCRNHEQLAAGLTQFWSASEGEKKSMEK